MKKTFIYEVAGQEKEDTKAFGTAWAWAKELATETGAEIHRTVLDERTGQERHEFLATGMVFLNMEEHTPEKAKHF